VIAKPGAPVTDLIPRLVESLELTGSGCLLQFGVAGRVQRRMKSPEMQMAVDEAIKRKRETGLPFWESMFANVQSQNESGKNEVLELAQFHQRMEDVATPVIFELSRQEAEFAIDQSTKNLQATEILAMSSRLRIESGAELHIPMLDFRVPVTTENTDIVIRVLSRLNVKGWLLNSGRSYHFIGSAPLLGLGQLTSFLGKSMLYAPIIDGRWVAHQLIEGSCALRLSSGSAHQVIPKVIAEIGSF
jgi:hypothetical protein